MKRMVSAGKKDNKLREGVKLSQIQNEYSIRSERSACVVSECFLAVVSGFKPVSFNQGEETKK